MDSSTPLPDNESELKQSTYVTSWSVSYILAWKDKLILLYWIRGRQLEWMCFPVLIVTELNSTV